MFRRLIAIFLLCASLLGLAQPLMACAAAMSASDCCSGDPASGCTTDATPVLVATSGSCCLATPAAPTSSFVAPSRSVDETLLGAETPGSFHSASVPGGDGRTITTCSSVRAAGAARATAATLTYLHTARLRL